MKKMGLIAAMFVEKIAIALAIFSVNTTCVHKYYQEKFDDRIDSLRKY